MCDNKRDIAYREGWTQGKRGLSNSTADGSDERYAAGLLGVSDDFWAGFEDGRKNHNV